MKKIVFKKNIKSEQPQEGKSNVELKSFKRSSDKNTDFSFNEDNIVEALKNIMDPELPVSIVDLGLIYNVETADNNINIKKIRLMIILTQIVVGHHVEAKNLRES